MFPIISQRKRLNKGEIMNDVKCYFIKFVIDSYVFVIISKKEKKKRKKKHKNLAAAAVLCTQYTTQGAAFGAV